MIERIKNNIPNLFTLLNLCCGVLGIILLFDGQMVNACYLIWLAAIFDFLDGFLARMLKAHSDIGKQLDSLADLVTFGVLPGLTYFVLLQGKFDLPLEYFAFLVVIFSALRLAKFNIDESQSHAFKGLPTPANALLASSIPIIIQEESLLDPYFHNEYLLMGIMLISAVLMVVPLTLLSFKIRDLHIGQNIDKLFLFISSLVMLVLFRESAIPLIILLYVLTSVVVNFGKNVKE